MWKKNRIAAFLGLLFFVVAAVEIVAEFFEDNTMLWLSKPLLMPILILFYLNKSKKANIVFITALLFTWLSNMAFIVKEFQFIFIGSLLFLIYKLLIIYLVASKIKFPTVYPILIGALPFIFLYVVTTFFTYQLMGSNIYIFLLHGIFSIILGAISLGNYILLPKKSNFILFVSTMLFAITQFIFVLKYYYQHNGLYQGLAMLLFAVGQYLLVQYFILTDKRKSKYEIVNFLKEV